MGHVVKELKNEGLGCHEYDYMPLSDPFVVRKLIKYRSKVDPYYYEKKYPSGLASSGDMEFKEPIFVTYVDLDVLIETCKLSKMQRTVLDMLMLGYSERDIADRMHVLPQTCRAHYDRAVSKIVQENNRRWEKVILPKTNNS